MKKNDIVMCIYNYSFDQQLTVGKEYKVFAGNGDSDFVNSGKVSKNGFIIQDDSGEFIYCVYPLCLFGQWELIKS